MAGVVAGVVIETADASDAIVARLADAYGITVEGKDERGRFAGVWEGPDGMALESLAEDMVAAEEIVLGVYPVYVAINEPVVF